MDTNNEDGTGQTVGGAARWWARPAVAAILLALVGSALWDFLVKPGLTAGWSIALALLTFGSTTVQDSIFYSAAMDPTALPALGLFIVLSGAPFGLAAARRRAFQRWKRRRVERQSTQRPAEPKWLRLLMNFLFVVSGLVVTVAVLQVNQSIVVWREFHANLRIITPHLRTEDRDILLSRFSSMRSKREYQALSADMRAVATAHNMRLSLDR